MKKRSKYWWISLIVGIVATILGIWSIFQPGGALLGMTYAFMAGFLFSGIMDIVFAVSNRKHMPGWGWGLAGGLLDTIFGIMLLVLPLPIVTMLLVYYVGFWILFRSIWTIGIAVELNNYTNAAWLLILGVLSLVFSVFYLGSPAFGGITIIALLSASLILYGISRIYYSLQLRSLNKKIKQD